MLWQWHPWQLQTRICMKYSANKGCVKIWMTGFYFNLKLINGFFKHPDESPDDPYLLWSKIIHQLLLEIGCLPRNPDYLLFQYKHWNEHHSVSNCYVNCGYKKWFYSTWLQYFSSCFYSCSVLRTPSIRSMRSRWRPCWSAETLAQSTIWRPHSGGSAVAMDSQTLGGMTSWLVLWLFQSLFLPGRWRFVTNL